MDPRSGEIIFATVVVAHGWVDAMRREARLFGLEPSDAHVVAGLMDLVSHEVGHGLGLRHNFKGSLGVPFDKLSDDAWIKANGLGSSVMDYSAMNFLGGVHFPQRPGSYDVAAIQYGYSKLDYPFTIVMGPFVMELATNLASVAAAAGAFGTDEDVGDPETATYDLSDNPVAHHDAVVSRMFSNIANIDGVENWKERGDVVAASLSRLTSAATAALSFVDGVVVDRRGQGTARLSSTTTQNAALKLVLRVVADRSNLSKRNVSWLVEAGDACGTSAETYCSGVVSRSWRDELLKVRVDLATKLANATRANSTTIAVALNDVEDAVRCVWWLYLPRSKRGLHRINTTWWMDCIDA